MTDNQPKKLWSQQTVEERVRTTLRHQQKIVEGMDPGDQFLTHHNAVNDPVRYMMVDLNRHFMRVLEQILEEPAK
jgi:hypothetical protein